MRQEPWSSAIPVAGRSWSPAALRPLGSCLLTPQSWTSDLQISETVKCLWLKPPSLLGFVSSAMGNKYSRMLQVRDTPVTQRAACQPHTTRLGNTAGWAGDGSRHLEMGATQLLGGEEDSVAGHSLNHSCIQTRHCLSPPQALVPASCSLG